MNGFPQTNSARTEISNNIQFNILRAICRINNVQLVNYSYQHKSRSDIVQLKTNFSKFNSLKNKNLFDSMLRKLNRIQPQWANAYHKEAAKIATMTHNEVSIQCSLRTIKNEVMNQIK